MKARLNTQVAGALAFVEERNRMHNCANAINTRGKVVPIDIHEKDFVLFLNIVTGAKVRALHGALFPMISQTSFAIARKALPGRAASIRSAESGGEASV